MKITKTELQDALVIECEQMHDERGYFSRIFSREDFKGANLEDCSYQCSISNNHIKGTLRGMHFQIAPFEETKLVRCTSGKIWDVIIDLRPHSQTFMKWTGVELSRVNALALYIPKGFAHGFISLEDNSEVLYQMAEPYSPDHARGIIWDDETIGIKWPIAPVLMSEKDSRLPKFNRLDYK